ncbi:class I SAM-dependent methyltransferase [Thalassotalea atypica]|uniref:class I SAM-dependent methyltransferase n=1 Tax=Thalassotalea atypica TaxID=2054316 RepID=UPI002573C727|nr:class I SAM-dependent methyltransferase [Thalassotalea atypica]
MNKIISTPLIALGLMSILSSAIVQAGTPADKQFMAAMQSSERADADKARDENRKPSKVMKFFGVKPGMKVLEVLASGGYYTEVLSHRVGGSGKVYAQNNKFILEVLNGRFAKEFAERTANNRLSNVTHYKSEFDDIDLKNEIDVVTIVLNYHDFYSNFSKEKRIEILKTLKATLKPGGILGLIDMESGTTVHNKDLHRIHHQDVRDDFKEAGFVLDAEAAFLRNPNDDYSKMVFEPSVRGKTDRFVFRFKA